MITPTVEQYRAAMIRGDVESAAAIEADHDLLGYPPEMVELGLRAADNERDAMRYRMLRDRAVAVEHLPHSMARIVRFMPHPVKFGTVGLYLDRELDAMIAKGEG